MYKYLEYVLINEGSEKSPTYIYWKHQLKKVIDEYWLDISVYIDKLSKKNIIKFKAGNKEYDYYAVIIENKGSEDLFLMQDTENVIETFIEKFKKEFWKNPDVYIKNMKYKPKCLGDLSHVELSNTFNL